MAVLISEGIGTGFPNNRRLVRLSDGTLYCVYNRADPALYGIFVKKSSDDGATWTNETKISTYAGQDANHQFNPSIAVDSGGNLHVAWHGNATGFSKFQIWYAKFNGTSWSTPVRISDYSGMENDNQKNASITVDSNDYLHVVWEGQATGFTAQDQIWYNTYTSSWAGPVRISTYTGMQSYLQGSASITVDSHDYIHVAWHGKATGYTSDNQVWWNMNDGSWGTPERISNIPAMQGYSNTSPSIAVDSSDNIHVAWHNEYDHICYNKRTGGSWGTALASQGSGSYPSLVIDSKDVLHIVYQGAGAHNDKVKYSKYDGAWSIDNILDDMDYAVSHANGRWSRYPSSNIPADGVDYVFTKAAVSLPFYIYWNYKDNPFPAPTGMRGLNPALMEILGY